MAARLRCDAIAVRRRSRQPAGLQPMSHEAHQTRLRPILISFDVFGTLVSVRESSYGAFERILAETGAHRVDVKAFWEHWEHRNIVHYWKPYRTYREICELSLEETFDLVCTAQRAKGYKPDGALFRYLIEHAGCAKEEILHVGQSQFTDLVGGKPLGLTIAWINRRQAALDVSVPRPDFIFSDLQSLNDLVEL
jgi:FMN phosphatase YigB (HAD superfamily)